MKKQTINLNKEIKNMTSSQFIDMIGDEIGFSIRENIEKSKAKNSIDYQEIGNYYDFDYREKTDYINDMKYVIEEISKLPHLEFDFTSDFENDLWRIWSDIQISEEEYKWKMYDDDFRNDLIERFYSGELYSFEDEYSNLIINININK